MNDISSPAPPPRRYLSVVLPHLPTDRIRRLALGPSWRSGRPPDAPLVVAAKVKSALRLVALDATAGRLGLHCGQPLADARAMVPHLEAVAEDAAADQALLAAIADWAERYTPLVALDPPDGLMLDITGAAHLFGGETAMTDDIAGRLSGRGFAVRAAIADTPGAAHAAARLTAIAVVPAGESRGLLAPLPLAALRLDPATVAALDRVGLKRIGQILDAPRAPLAARFGASLLRQIDRALGSEEEAIGPRRPVPALIAERRFAEPIVSEDDIARTLRSLAEALAGSLEARGAGARAYELALFRVDGAVARLAVATSRPVRAAKLVVELFREKFAGLAEEIDAGFGFDMVRLAVPHTADAGPVQVDLAGETAGEADLDQLVDRIAARLGPAHVGRLAPRDSHIPERAVAFLPGEAASAAAAEAPGGPVARPLRLFARPEPVEATAAVPDGPPVRFRWRRAVYRVARAEGPERIAPEWWQDEALTRDYFRVEDPAGHRFWLYREGLYGRETAAPRWYVHGVFA